MPKKASSGALDGVAVLVTRPAPQAGRLLELIRRGGGEPVLFPTLEIAPVAPEAAVLEELADCDTLVFVSANAVEHGRALFSSQDLVGKRLAAIGPATRRALEKAGYHDIEQPGEQSSTEALLQLPAFRDVAGRQIGIVRGRGGREALKQALVERGARVVEIDCYERRMPAGFDPCVATRELARDDRQLVISVTSVTGLSNLFEMLPDDQHPALSSRPLVVIGERQAAAARQLGWRGEILVSKATDECIVDTLIDWRRRRFNAM